MRDTLRALAGAPGFTATVVLTLAIGIGAATAVFSVVNSVLLRPLPYPNPEELVSIWHTAPGAPGLAEVSGGLRTSPSMYVTYAEQNRTFEHVGLWFPGTASVTGLAEPEEVRVVAVTDGVLQTLGVPPLLGRWFSAEEQRFGAPRTALLTYDYWQRRFGGDESVVGRTITVDAIAAEIVGVMPKGYRIVDTDADLIGPFPIDRSRLTLPPFCCQGIARLKPSATIAEADADIARMLPIWMDSWPYAGDARAVYEEGWRISPAVRPLKRDVVGNVGNVLWVVMGTIGVVLLIACTNVMNLLLVRVEARQRELAVRAALGAGVWRLGRTLLAETLLLGLIGGTLGVALAYAALQLLLVMGPQDLPRLEEISMDLRALGFALLASLVSGLVFGSIPALKYAHPRISTSLHTGGRGSSQGRERHRTQNVLVVAQVALALVLLVSSGLMIRTFLALREVEPGFTAAAELQTLRIGIPASLVPEPERVTRMQNDILDALAAIPGVESAAFASAMPLEGAYSNWDAIDVEARAEPPGSERVLRTFKYVSPDFFATVGTRLIAGRDITWTDVYGDRRVAIVSENLARELWSEPAAAVGKRIRLGGGGESTPWREVVGVVQDVRENGLQEPPPTIVYWPSMMSNVYRSGEGWLQRAVTIVMRSSLAGTGPLQRQIEQAVWSVSPSLPVASMRTMQDVYDQSLARTSFTLVMLAIGASAALVLGVVGLYGVLSYAVSQRRREIAIRLALGEQQRDVRRRFVRHGVALTSVGVVLGLGAAAAVTRVMTSLLFETRPVDLPTYVAVAALLTLVAALASYLPARRASAVDPAEALTAE